MTTPYIPENLKLTQDGAQALLLKVGEQIAGCPSYRLGQGIYNLLRETPLADIVWQTELDFFYWTDDNLVMETFYEHFVRGR